MYCIIKNGRYNFTYLIYSIWWILYWKYNYKWKRFLKKKLLLDNCSSNTTFLIRKILIFPKYVNLKCENVLMFLLTKCKPNFYITLAFNSWNFKKCILNLKKLTKFSSQSNTENKTGLYNRCPFILWEKFKNIL